MSSDNVVPFPRQLRLVPAATDERAEPRQSRDQATLVDHDGGVYPVGDLIWHLSPAELKAVGETAPRSAQELWDEVVRRWPALAAEIVAGVSQSSRRRCDVL